MRPTDDRWYINRELSHGLSISDSVLTRCYFTTYSQIAKSLETNYTWNQCTLDIYPRPFGISVVYKSIVSVQDVTGYAHLGQEISHSCLLAPIYVCLLYLALLSLTAVWALTLHLHVVVSRISLPSEYGSAEGPPRVVKNRNFLSHPDDLGMEAYVTRVT